MRGGSGYSLGDRDGESCLDTVLLLLQPPSIAENSFDPAPETSWNYEEDTTAFGPSVEDYESVRLDIRTLFYQDCKEHGGSQCIAAGQLSAYQTQSDMSRVQQTGAIQRWTEHQRNPMPEQTAADQGDSSATPMQKSREGPQGRDGSSISTHNIVGQACQSFTDSFIHADEDTVDSACNVMPRHYRFSSTYDAQLDDSRSGGLDPGYYVQQTVSSSHELSARLHCNPSDACELTALVRHHTSICLRQTSSSHTSSFEPLAAHQTNQSGTWFIADWQGSSKDQASLPLYHNNEPHVHVPLEVAAIVKELEEDQGVRASGVAVQEQRDLLESSYREVATACQPSTGLQYAALSDPVVPDLSPGAGTAVLDYWPWYSGQESRHLALQQHPNTMAGARDLSDAFLIQAWRKLMQLHASTTCHEITENGRASEPSGGLAQGNHQDDGYDASLKGLVTGRVSTKLPLTCSQVAATSFTAPPAYSTRVASEVKCISKVQRSMSAENEPVQTGSCEASHTRLKRKLDSSNLSSQGPHQSAWFGMVHHQELSSELARLHQYCGLADPPNCISPRVQVSTNAAHHVDEVSILHQVSSNQSCASISRLPTSQDFQPSTPEAKELKAAAASLMELCVSGENVQPVPLALRLPPKLSEVDMARLLQAYRHLNPFQVKEHFPFVKEADVYSLHPSDLIAGAGAGQYFFSETKYGSIKKPTRLRITKNGYRWKQQGRTFAIQEGGRTVAFKTYLSYVPLKNTSKAQGNYPYICERPNEQQKSLVGCNVNDNPHSGNKTAASTTSYSPTAAGCDRHFISSDQRSQSRIEHSAAGYCKSSSGSHRKWALWTMEEIALAEDVDMERKIFKRGGVPRPFPVLCKIGCRTPVEDGGHQSRNILPCAVPITPPGFIPMSQERRRRTRLRHQFKKVIKQTYSGILMTASSVTDGPSLTGACGTSHLPPSNSNPQLLLTC